MRMYNPPHPGLLIKEYIEDFDSNVSDFAQKLGVTRVTLSRIVNGKSAIMPEMAIRLSQLLPNTTPKLWLGMQSDYDVWQLEQQPRPHITPLFGNTQQGCNTLSPASGID